MPPAQVSTSSRRLMLLGAAAIVLTALNLRPAVTATGALLADVRTATDMSSTVAGLLTSLPPVCFAAVGLAAGRLGRLAGTAPAMIGAMLVLAVALGARAGVSSAAAFVALSAVALSAMAVGNVLLPVAVKQQFPDRVGRATGWYSLGLALGTAGAAGVSVPIADAAGGWRAGLAFWAVPALLAALPWWWLRRTDRAARARADDGSAPAAGATAVPAGSGDDGASARQTGRAVRRHPRSWALAGFFGLQGLAAYTLMGWLPSIFQDAGLSAGQAGWMLAITTGVGAPVSVLLPELAARRGDQRWWPVGLAACAATAYVGLLQAPAAFPVVWATLLGIGMGAFPLALVLIGLRARSDAGTATLSALAQGIGYAIAALGPASIGALHDATGGWRVPLLVLIGLLVPQLALGMVAGRAGHVDAPAARP